MAILVILAAYLLGSLPMGYFTVKLIARKDITQVGSGRTGGTNAMRAGGIPVGALTGLLDILKGFAAVALAKWVFPSAIWIQVLAGVAAVLGHNWSIILYLLSKKFSAGAGTGPNVGAAMAFWPGIVLFGVPMVIFFVFVVGYASLASLSVAVIVIVVFFFRYLTLNTPWQYAIYGIFTTILVTLALLPNIRRLLEGKERRVGIFAKKENTFINGN
jgi:glycerol-3-phosphate acyltransferase PlsY